MSNDTTQSSTLDAIALLLRSRASRHAWMGLAIAVAALVAATLLASLTAEGAITLGGMLAAQRTNPALWLLDTMPFLFLVWGQYVGMVMSYQAGAMVLDQTRELREQATVLQYELARSPMSGPQLGLPNRHAFTTELAKQIARSKVGGGGPAVLLLETQQYREVLQQQGVEAAEELVRQIAERLQRVLTDSELLAHFGYDDFAILMLRVADAQEARRLAERIELALDTPVSVRRQSMSVRAGIGIALYPEHGEDPETLLRRSATAKYAAAAERREFLIYAPRLESERADRPRLTADLHAALYHEGLTEEYVVQLPLQPESPLRLRFSPYWLHPRKGRIEEDQFLDLPDRVSLVHSLSLWLLRQGLSRYAEWRRERHDDRLSLVLRLPEASLAQLGLADMILRLLAAHDVEPAALTLEVTETLLAAGGHHARVQAEILRGEGVSLCLLGLGDLGASPATLLHFPVNEAKLAAGALRRAPDDPVAEVVLSGLAGIMRQADVRLTAGGVDTQHLRDLAANIGCRWIEGTVASPRLSTGKAIHWLQQHGEPAWEPAGSPG